MAHTDLSRRTFIGQAALALGCISIGSPAASQALITPPPLKAGRYQFTIVRPQRPLPSVRLQRLDGSVTELSEFEGRVTLINFWATWCLPCRVELPILDRLRAARGDRLHVVAISIDEGGRGTVEPFLRELKIRMPVYLDPRGELAHTDRENRKNAPFALYGLPITYVAASSGRIVGYIAGAVEWNSPEGMAFLDYLEAT